MTKSFRILIVDDQLRTRQSLKALLTTKFPHIEIAEAANGIEAFQSIEKFKPHVVVIDVLMPEMDGLTCTRLIKSITPQIRVIVLTMYADYRAAALAAGADVFINKGEPPEKLLAAVADSTGKTEDQDEQAV
ncbi:MAG: response regulator transcription factor [Chloroflexi bacterium]|nr:response regulator transcription factor [Chloroflexota bacterium]